MTTRESRMHACLTWYMTSFQSSPVRIWKTVSMATEKESKLVGGLPSGKLKVPPKSCMPSSAAMRMKRKRRSSSEMMDFIEETSDTSRLRREDQYLKETAVGNDLNSVMCCSQYGLQRVAKLFLHVWIFQV